MSTQCDFYSHEILVLLLLDMRYVILYKVKLPDHGQH